MGPGLIFETLPLAFGQMPAGSLFGGLFFILIFFAAITSSIALIEPAVAWLAENRGLSRPKASLYAGSICWFLGLGSLLSFNAWSDATWFGRNFFELVDFVTADIMLPIGGILVAVFASWVLQTQDSEQELELGDRYIWWKILTRYVAPIGVGMVFLHAMEIF